MPITEVPSAKPEISFGNGRYSAAMRELYDDLQVLFKVPEEKAEKIARQFGSDFGAAMASAAVNTSVGKATGKNSRMTLKEAASVKGITATYALSIARAVQWANEAFKNGVSRKDTKWTFISQLAEYVAEL
jgi:hypothetical protein